MHKNDSKAYSDSLDFSLSAQIPTNMKLDSRSFSMAQAGHAQR